METLLTEIISFTRNCEGVSGLLKAGPQLFYCSTLRVLNPLRRMSWPSWIRTCCSAARHASRLRGYYRGCADERGAGMAELLMAEGSFNAPSKILVLSPNSVLCCRYSLRSYSNLGIQIKVQAADKIPLFNANTLRIFKFGCTRI